MTRANKLEPEDFPVPADNETLKTPNGKRIGSGVSAPVAKEIADRLNEQAQRDEDRWSAGRFDGERRT